MPFSSRPLAFSQRPSCHLRCYLIGLLGSVRHRTTVQLSSVLRQVENVIGIVDDRESIERSVPYLHVRFDELEDLLELIVRKLRAREFQPLTDVPCAPLRSPCRHDALTPREQC